jgi:hypothetical protein
VARTAGRLGAAGTRNKGQLQAVLRKVQLFARAGATKGGDVKVADMEQLDARVASQCKQPLFSASNRCHACTLALARTLQLSRLLTKISAVSSPSPATIREDLPSRREVTFLHHSTLDYATQVASHSPATTQTSFQRRSASISENCALV